MNLLEPWILLRVLAGVVASALFVRAAVVAALVLRHYGERRATEGQLAVERQAELGLTFVRVAAFVQIASLLLSVLAADRLHHAVRGAMCAYGVFSANDWGFVSLGASCVTALAAGAVLQLAAFDRHVRGLTLLRPLAAVTLFVCPLALFDMFATTRFLTELDLNVVASCCSVQLDAEGAGRLGFAEGPRQLSSILALVGAVASVGFAWRVARKPTRAGGLLAAVSAVLTLPWALAAAVLEVAPHAFEVPSHVCPFCLLRADVFGVGYMLFGALFACGVWAFGALLTSVASGSLSRTDEFSAFVRSRSQRLAAGWTVALVVGAWPVARYWFVAGGASLFP
jgi:hypothetical protein